MTAKETKETIRILNNYKMSCNSCEFHHELGCELENNCDEAVYMAISALEKADKYKWHDLRKDSNDLPKEDGEYLVKVLSIGKYPTSYYISEYYKVGLTDWLSYNKIKIIAWCEFDHFEEV